MYLMYSNIYIEYTYTLKHLYIFPLIFIYIYLHEQTYLHMLIYLCTLTHIHLIHTHSYTYTYTQTFTHIHTHNTLKLPCAFTQPYCIDVRKSKPIENFMNLLESNKLKRGAWGADSSSVGPCPMKLKNTFVD